VVVNIYRYCIHYTSGDVSYQTINGDAVSVFAWGVWKSHEIFGIPAVLIEIRVAHLQNTSLDLNHYTRTFGLCYLIFTMAHQPPVCQGLLIVETSRPHSVRHITLGTTPLYEWSVRRRDNTKHSQQTDIRALRRNSNPPSQQASDRRPTP